MDLEQKIKEFEKVLIQEALHTEYAMLKHKLTILIQVYREHFNLKNGN